MCRTSPRSKAWRRRRTSHEHGRTLLADYLDQELAAGERVILSNDEFVVVVPYWAVWPFEVLVLPRSR